MTFLYSFFPDATAFLLSADIHHLSDMICTPYVWPSWHVLLRAVPTEATEKFKSDFFFFSFSFDTQLYVCSISPVPKYSGGLSLRKKKVSGKLKSTPLIVLQYMCYRAQGSVFIGPLVRSVSVGAAGGDAKQQVHRVSVCLCQMVLSVIMIHCMCSFALWSIKIWEVYSSRRPIHSRARSVHVWRPREVVRQATGRSVMIPSLLWSSCSRD